MEKQREMNFKQTGYSMQYTVSHDTTVVCMCVVGGCECVRLALNQRRSDMRAQITTSSVH